MNIELAQRMVTQMRAEAHRVRMSQWVGRYGLLSTIGEVAEDCGTTGCVAGWAVLLSEEHQDINFVRDDINWEKEGLRLLGLHADDRYLFFTDEWPEEAFDVWWERKHAGEEEGTIIADLIELLIKFDGNLDDAFDEFILQDKIRKLENENEGENPDEI